MPVRKKKHNISLFMWRYLLSQKCATYEAQCISFLIEEETQGEERVSADELFKLRKLQETTIKRN